MAVPTINTRGPAVQKYFFRRADKAVPNIKFCRAENLQNHGAQEQVLPSHRPRPTTGPMSVAAVRRTSPKTQSKKKGPASKGTPTQGRNLKNERTKAPRTVRIRGAREHNLKNVNIEIPRDQLVVITGLSGSGKSSLAFDTIFAEGQRKYMESLSSYARQFLKPPKKPDVDDVEGLPPTIAIEQRTSGQATPRSTVATTTEIYDYLRLLFARAGRPTCWHPTKIEAAKGNESKSNATGRNHSKVLERCGQAIESSHPSQITERVSQLPEGTRISVLAPIVQAKKGFHRDTLEDLASQGFVRARVNGNILDIEDTLAGTTNPSGKNSDNRSSKALTNPLKLNKNMRHNVDAVVDRLVLRPDNRSRLSDSVETALKVAKGRVIIVDHGNKEHPKETLYSEHMACPLHAEAALDELEPRLFSFNSPQGACGDCQGLGVLLKFDPDRLMPDPDKTLLSGGIAPWARNGPAGMFASRIIRRVCKALGVSTSTTVGSLNTAQRNFILYGDEAGEADTRKRPSTTTGKKRTFGKKRAGEPAWEGAIPMLQDWMENTESEGVRQFLHPFLSNADCPTCDGKRLGPASLGVFLQSKGKLPAPIVKRRSDMGFTSDPHLFNVGDFTHLSIEEAEHLLDDLDLGEEQTKIGTPILREVRSRLQFLGSVGLGYLSLDRRTSTLSGGEAQRIRLATQVGSGLAGAAYVLDEPTIGLHPRDNERLIRTLRKLADLGNSVLVVEHDEELIRAADHVIDVGPGPGRHGGEIIAQGTVTELKKAKQSFTGQYLKGTRTIATPKPSERRTLNPKKAIRIKGARANNLKGTDTSFPLGGIVCVTGVSGSGKSTLVNDTLLALAKQRLNASRVDVGEHKSFSGFDQIDRVVAVDQSPIGRTPRSNPATYTGMFDEIRSLFTKLPEAKARGYLPGRFSFNVKGGRCEACAGQGEKRIEMHFLSDVFVTCEVCHGTRYSAETLQIRYRDKNIADVLAMPAEQALEFFENVPKIRPIAQCLVDVGLGYVALGQPSTTLSGGEAQRIKLSTELWKGNTLRAQTEHNLYVLDEPTTGLHMEDVRRLVDVFDKLVDQGNTLVLIEHHLDVIKRADWIIDLGPEGGDGGGHIVATGTPETVAQHPESLTGQFLKPMLQ